MAARDTSIVEFTATLVESVQHAYSKKWSFLGIFALVFIGSTVVLAQLDLLPNAPSASITSFSGVVTNDLTKSSQSAFVAPSVASLITTEEPLQVMIPTIGLKATIANPTTTDVVVLDALLLKGAVRYPTSAKLGETGNVVLFGHSSYLPIVRNQAYKAFNDIQKLKKGDRVTVSSSGTAYTYAVRTVTKESIADAVIPLSVTGRVLTLSTCDSFGTKSDRFVVVADFVESHSQGA